MVEEALRLLFASRPELRFEAAIQLFKDGEVTLSKYDKNRTCNSIVNDYGSQGDHEKVKAMAMDTFFKENNIEKCDFMKFDVEGAEDLILRSEGFKNVSSNFIS